jgi:hypothetical protein
MLACRVVSRSRVFFKYIYIFKLFIYLFKFEKLIIIF